jgi:hypothetical protein
MLSEIQMRNRVESPDSLSQLFADLPAFNPRKWVECKIKDPAKKEIALGAVEAFDHLITRKRILSEDLAPILKAVQHTSRVVADVGAERLMGLAEKHNIVLDTLRELFESGKSKDRFMIIAYLIETLPRDFLLDIVGKGLSDKSTQIRWKAAQACGSIGLKELLPLMENRLSLEKSANALHALKTSIGILRDGYYLYYSGGHPWLTIKKASGRIVSMGLRQEQIDKEGLQVIVERGKNEP